MQIFIVTHSSTYDCRAEAAGEYFIHKGNTVQYIFSDFDHLRRARRGISGTAGKTDSGSAVYLPMRPYRKNLSARRLLSIRRFALVPDPGKFLCPGCVCAKETIRCEDCSGFD